MNARLALAGLSLSLLVAGCASTAGGTSGSTGVGAPVSTGSPAPGAGAAGTAATGADAGVAAGAGDNAGGQRAGGSADPGVPAKTAAERRADLDQQLDASLDRFDEKLRGEQQRTASERDSQATARADGAVVDATSSGERERDDIRRDRSGDLQSAGVQDAAAGAASQSASGSGANAKPIPSGVDDDIIARRLRRAAENETDPELKEKLWNEYRDYKENTQGSK